MSATTAGIAPALEPWRGSQAAALPRIWLVLLLAACITQFTSAWLYGERVVDVAAVSQGEFTRKSGSVPFQYLLWLNLVLLGFLHFRRHGRALIGLLAPFWPYGAVCVLASLVGFNPAGAVKPAILWGVAVLSAGLIAWHLPGRTLARAIVGVMLALMLGSIAVALLLPARGTHAYFATTAWAGLFVLKNQLGWIASLALVLSLTLWRPAGPRLAAPCVAASLVCLAGSLSMGALVATVAGIGYVVVVAWLRRRVRPVLAVVLLAGLSGALVLLAAMAAQPLAEAMGRDLTLTGRTLIWSAYLQEIANSPWIGRGVGAFTGTSPFTLPVAFRFRDFGLITTPHNLFLAIVGDAGIAGLVAFVAMFGWFALVVPLRESGPFVQALAGLTAVSALQGLVETHDAFGPGPTWFLLSLVWVASRRWAADDEAGGVAAEAAGPGPAPPPVLAGSEAAAATFALPATAIRR